MSAPTATTAYRQASIMTATPAQLVVALYDGAGRFLAQTGAAMKANDPRGAGERLRRAEDILLHLLGTLDHERGGEIADRLRALYAFSLDRLADARRTQDPALVAEVAGLLADLRESWAEIAGA